jgi:hypothetical protein
LYLLHGAGDDSWTSVGRADFILDAPEARKGLKLLWFATGKKDFLMPADP